MHAALALSLSNAGLAAPQRHRQNEVPEASTSRPPAQPIWGSDVSKSFGTNPVFNRGEQSANWRHVSTTNECADWLADQLRTKSAKQIARDSGVNQRAAESVKQGRNGLTMAHLVNMCRADAEFRRAFFQFCNGHLEGDPDLVAGLTLAVQSFMRNREAGK